MAGSFRHIIDKKTLKFEGIDLLDDMGDAFEALEECYDMIIYLSKGSRRKLSKAHLEGHIKKRTSKENYRRVKKMLKREKYL